MLSSTATRCGHPPGVHAASTSNPTPPTLLPPPPTGFLACPTQHGLGRTSLQSSNEEKLLQAIISSISCRLEKLSLSDDPVLESATPTVLSPVYIETPAGTHSTPSQHPVRSRLVDTKAKLFERLSNGLKAGLYRSMKKRRDLKKHQAPIPPPPASRCSLADHQDYLLGRRVPAMGGLSVSDSTEVNANSRDTMFQGLSAFAVQGTPAPEAINPTFLEPWSSDTSPSTSTSTVWTLGDEVTDDTMDEDEQPSPSPRPTSPTPMDFEASPPSSEATAAPESPQAPFEASAPSDSGDSVEEPTDQVMSDEEQGFSSSEGPHQTEPTDMIIDPSSTESGSSALSGREVDMVDAEDPRRTTSFEPPTTSSAQLTRDAPASNESSRLATSATNPDPAPAPVNSATVEAPFYQAEELSSATSEPNVTNRQVANTQPTDSAPTPPADATLNPAAVDHAARLASAPTSTAGPSTPTPASAPTTSTQMPGQATNGHASCVHQVLSKLRLSKRAPQSTQPSVNDEASEEAEAKAFFANLSKVAPRRNPAQSQAKPVPPPPSSGPKQTKGSACRSLMDDLMAGFRKSSQEQTAATRSSAQSPPATTTVPITSPATGPTRPLPPSSGRQTNRQPTLPSSVVETRRYVVASPSGRAPATVSATGKVPSSSPTILSTRQASLPVVAGRQNGLNSPLPSSVGIGRQVAAQLSGRAPWTVSATDKVNGPSGSISTGTGTPSEAHQLSSAGMDDVEPGQRVIKGSGRVARATRRTGLTWQIVQQAAQQNQAAWNVAQSSAAASTALSSLERDLEERRSEEWHAAQPPPPPEAIPYIKTGEEYEGDENDDGALLDWILSQED
ncbi:hypothetical protein FRC00_005688 [Tulasnella sp. 408]|nr:hypothetical protein FRC00_005688 [Tulasnella sp. 408]